MSTTPSLQVRRRQANRQMLIRLLIIVPVMFAFGYALVPLYKKICEVTGINSLTNKSDFANIKNTQIDYTRKITIEFDANVRGAMRFVPMRSSMQIHPGEMAQVMYRVENTEKQTLAAQAIPSYAPLQAGRYFQKLDCFCFTQQNLKPYEVKQLPVVFVIDPDLPKEIETITLSYTFFKLK